MRKGPSPTRSVWSTSTPDRRATSIAFVVAALVALRAVLDLHVLQVAAALLLFAFGLYRFAARHRARGGM